MGDTERDLTAPSHAIPLPPDKLNFCKCGKGKCPIAELLPEGGFELRDDEAGLKPVRFDAEQATRLRSWLQEHGY
jgi:hypothetical protein